MVSAALSSPDRIGSSQQRAWAEPACVVGLACFAVLILRWRWIGYQGHDDAFFAAAALDWVRHFPALGTNHWALRDPLVLPIAGVIAAFGPSLAALAVVNLATYAGFLTVTYAAMRHWFGWKAAVAATVIGIVLPVFPVQATYADTDMPEMAMVVTSIWCLMLARERSGSWLLLLLSGVLAGTGFLLRETSIELVAFYGLLLLFRPRMPRWRYGFIVLGFAAVVGGQMTYFAARTGDPLYRMRLSATHDHVDRADMYARAVGAGQATDSEGVLAIRPALAPFAAVLVSQKFGLLFYLAVPSYVVLRLSRRLTSRQVAALDCVAAGALVSFLFVAMSAGILYVVPRYFMVTAALATVPVALLAADLLERGRRVLLAALTAAFVLSSLALLYLENADPAYAEERIVDAIEAAQEPVHLDPETAGRIAFPLLVRHGAGQVTTAPPGPGDLIAAKEGLIEACLRSRHCGWIDQVQSFTPTPAWVELSRWEPPHRTAGSLLRAMGLDRMLPPDILQKIERPGAAAILYRVSPASGEPREEHH